MSKAELQKNLISHCASFIATLKQLPKEELQFSRNGKWSPAKQLDHLVRSVAPVKLAFSLPTFLLRLYFGVANRPSRSYDELVAKYHAKLKAGGSASGRFVPPDKLVPIEARSEKLSNLTQSLSDKIGSFTEEELDRYILPHPLLGTLTLREMVYFTIYHSQHHQKQVVENSSMNSI